MKRNKKMKFLTLILAIFGLSLTGCAKEKVVKIYNRKDLEKINGIKEKTYQLMNDIDLGDEEWTPLEQLSGTFDGQNHTISGLKINTYHKNAGLFEKAADATIKNLKITNSEIKFADNLSEYGYVGFLFAKTYTFAQIEINNVVIEKSEINIDFTGADYSSSGAGMGGFAGLIEVSDLTIIKSESSVTINGGDSVGGFVGEGISSRYGDEKPNEIIFKKSVNNSKITGGDLVGGFIGSSRAALTFEECENKGDIKGLSSVGGLVGLAASDTEIKKSANIAKVTGQEDEVGGFVGYHYKDANAEREFLLKIDQSYNTGPISGDSSVGGILGSAYSDRVRIVNCYNLGNINFVNRGGGIVGFSGSKTETNIKNVYNFGTISGSSDNSILAGAGGIIGSAKALEVSNSINFGTLIGRYSVGPIIGEFDYNSFILNSYYTYSKEGFANVKGTLIKAQEVTKLFLVSTLNWDEGIWDFTGIDVINEVYPTLKPGA